MKITDRMGMIEGVDQAYWDSERERLVVYYHSVPLDTLRMKTLKAITDIQLQDSVKTITYILNS